MTADAAERAYRGFDKGMHSSRHSRRPANTGNFTKDGDFMRTCLRNTTKVAGTPITTGIYAGEIPVKTKLSDDWLAVLLEFLTSFSNVIEEEYEKSSPKSEENEDNPK